MNDTIEPCMTKAMLGSRDATEEFYKRFLKGPVVVPERYQSPKIEETVTYPNEFTNILGLEDRGQVFVPAFTSAELMKDWCQMDLKYKTLSGQELLSLVPESWWVWLNPGSEVEKEFSPWEIQELKNGPAGIPAVLDEICAAEPAETISISQLGETEYQNTKNALVDLSSRTPEVNKLFLAKEECLNEDDQKTYTVLVGIETTACSALEIEKLKSSFQAAAEKTLIGGDPVKTFVGAGGNSVILGLFRGIKPCYRKSRLSLLSSFLSKVRY